PLLNDVFLEFEDRSGDRRLLHQLDGGGEYEILVSTLSGLLRYRLGDRVRVSGRFQKTPLLEFIGRAGVVSDLVGEKLTAEFVEAELAPLTGAYFCLLPRDQGYELWVDGGGGPGIDSEAADRVLRQNVHYDRAIRLGQLTPVQVGGCENLAERLRRCAESIRGSRGAFKPPSLVADRSLAAAISRELRRMPTAHKA
ncbi:MAG: GH3 auxin-responsive promoter family protein, partial [Verrucomicrobiales bacterium]